MKLKWGDLEIKDGFNALISPHNWRSMEYMMAVLYDLRGYEMVGKCSFVGHPITSLYTDYVEVIVGSV